MEDFLTRLLAHREATAYDPVASSSVVISELYNPNCNWTYRAIVRGPEIWKIERWLEDNYGEDEFHITSGASGSLVYFKIESIGMNLMLTWTIG